MHPIVYADRCNSDQDKVLRGTVPILNLTSQMLESHLSHSLYTGKRFAMKSFLQGHLKQHLATTMLASHLAGMRRATLIWRENKGLAASLDVKLSPALELSTFGNVVEFLRKRRGVNLTELKQQYDTLAFQIVSGVSDDITNDITTTVDDLISNGAHVREAKQVMAAKFAEYGIKPSSKSNLETIFRTQSQITFAAGKYEVENNDPDIADILWGYRYVTVGDDRVRPTHAALDGVTLPKDDPFWNTLYPPNGYNCRCQAIPLFSRQRIVYPPLLMGVPIRPDKGFSWSAGKVFSPMVA